MRSVTDLPGEETRRREEPRGLARARFGSGRAHAERPSPWYRLTGALNRLVWRAPLPRRVALRLSRWVYRSPPTSVAHAQRVLRAFADGAIAVHVVGGWGVDALVGRSTRTHRDIDLYVAFEDEARAALILADFGYSEHYRCTSDTPTFSRTVFSDGMGRVVDLHPVNFGRLEETFEEGRIGETPVSCLSRASQLQAHSGYRLRRHHRHDTALLKRLL